MDKFSAIPLAAIAAMVSDFRAQIALAIVLVILATIAYNRDPPPVSAVDLAQIHYDAVNLVETYGNWGYYN